MFKMRFKRIQFDSRRVCEGLIFCVILIATSLGYAEEISVVCVGDIMLSGSVTPFIDKHGVDYPFDKTRDIVQAADIAIGNLEMSLATVGEPVPNKKYTFRGSPMLAEGIANAGFDVLTLANNHTGDYGNEALLETVAVLRGHRIQHCGAGADLHGARKPAIVEARGKRIAVLGYATTYPSAFFAGEGDPGTAQGKPKFFVPDIKAAKKQADIVIVTFHWSGELVTEPRGYQELFGRIAIDAGADLVFGHHPHVLQGIEVYKGKLIAYSLGNFAFASYSKKVRTSAILRVKFQDNGLARAALIPLNVFNREVLFQPTVLSGEAAEAVLNTVRELSRKWKTEIGTEGNLGVIQLNSSPETRH
jgi:poly-gamma-glutamate synthesis protein (capsule biosynthesis protein)